MCVHERERPRANFCVRVACAPTGRANVCVRVFVCARCLGARPGETPRERRLCAPSRLRRDSGRSCRRHCLTSPKSRRGAAGRADGWASAAAAAGRAGWGLRGWVEGGRRGRRAGDAGREGGAEGEAEAAGAAARPSRRLLLLGHPQMFWGPAVRGGEWKKAYPSLPTEKKGALKMMGGEPRGW